MKKPLQLITILLTAMILLTACGSGSTLSGTYNNPDSGGYVTFSGNNITIFTGLSTFTGTYEIQDEKIAVTFSNGEQESFRFKEIDSDTIEFDGSKLMKNLSANASKSESTEMVTETITEPDAVSSADEAIELLGKYQTDGFSLTFLEDNRCRIKVGFADITYSYEIIDGQIILTNQNETSNDYLKIETCDFKIIDSNNIEFDGTFLTKK